MEVLSQQDSCNFTNVSKLYLTSLERPAQGNVPFVEIVIVFLGTCKLSLETSWEPQGW
jgi:hypothetical protein